MPYPEDDILLSERRTSTEASHGEARMLDPCRLKSMIDAYPCIVTDSDLPFALRPDGQGRESWLPVISLASAAFKPATLSRVHAYGFRA